MQTIRIYIYIFIRVYVHTARAPTFLQNIYILANECERISIKYLLNEEEREREKKTKIICCTISKLRNVTL
jgi:hypothetical protein